MSNVDAKASAAKRGGRSRGNVEGEYYGDDGGGRGSADDDDDDEDGRDDWKRQAARRRRELGGGRSGGQSGLAWDALLSTGSGGSGGGGGGGRRSKQRPGAGRTSFRPQRMHELAQPNRKGQGKGRNNTGASGGRRGPAFASQDDAENCTFQPFTNSKKGRKNKKKPGGGGGGAGDDGDDESKSAGGFDSFVARMESKENARRRLLDKTRGEKEYNAKIDKKVCVRCGQKQSYDEVMKRKKNCTSCGGAYRPAKSWAECKDAFNDRYKLALDKRSAALKRAKEEVRRAEQTRTRKTFDSYTGKVVEEVVTPPAWEDIADSFVDRCVVRSCRLLPLLSGGGEGFGRVVRGACVRRILLCRRRVSACNAAVAAAAACAAVAAAAAAAAE